MNEELTPAQTRIITALPDLTIAEIASIIKRDWEGMVYFGAVPYLNAMTRMNKITENIGLDSGVSVVTYFIGNARTWKGPVARAVKEELNKRIKAI